MPVRIVTPYVNGGWLPRRRRPAEPVTAPFDGRTLAQVVAADAKDLDLAIAGSAGRAESPGRDVPAPSGRDPGRDRPPAR